MHSPSAGKLFDSKIKTVPFQLLLTAWNILLANVIIITQVFSAALAALCVLFLAQSGQATDADVLNFALNLGERFLFL